MPPPPPLRTTLRGDDRSIKPDDFARVQTASGKTFTLDAFCKSDGSNALVARFLSPANSFFDSTSLRGEHIWVNPPFHMIEQTLKHYLALKASSPDNTSACFLVPRWPGATWNKLLQGMQVLMSFTQGYPLFNLDRPGTGNTATPAIPWPVDVYHDPTYQPHAVKSTRHTAPEAALPAMHFKGAVSGTPAIVALDSQATHCFIDKQFARNAGIPCSPAHRMVQLADGSHTQIESQCNIHLKLFSQTGKAHSGKVPCLVIDLGDDHNLILGQDWLSREHAVMDFHTHTCSLPKAAGSEGLTLKATTQKMRHAHIKPTLSAARALKALAKGCTLLPVVVQSLPGPPPQLDIPDAVSPQIRAILEKHAPVFGKRQGLPPDRGTFLAIPELDGAVPQFKHPYRLSHLEVQEVETQIKELLRQGLIEPSNSPYGAPIIFVKKKDGTLRMCCDWRKLNAQTIKSRYPLPRIDELLDTLQGAQYFSSLDLQSGFHQILINPADVPKTAFTTPFGHYQWKVMSFGLCNAPAIFQETMNKVLAGHLRKGALVYMDDILIYAKTQEEHARLLDEILTLLGQNDFYVKFSKCEFEKTELKYVGHIVGKHGIKVDPAKTQVVRDWPTPTSVKDVRSFLGLANYFRKFVQGYSTLVEPLTQLTRKDTTWTAQTWDDKCEQAFQGVKEALTNAPVLTMPDTAGGQYEVICDASLVGTGAVLTQGGKPIAYISTKFSPAEKNWSTTEQELYAVINALKNWRCYLEGVPFTVVTDHNPLIFLQSQTNLTRKQARWSQYLQQFEFKWEYRPGRTNVADPLSRIPSIKKIQLNATTLKSMRVTRAQTGSLRKAPDREVTEQSDRPPKRKRSAKETAPAQPEPTQAQAEPAQAAAAPGAPAQASEADLLAQMREGYAQDKWFDCAPNAATRSANLTQRDGLWWTKNDQVVIPDVPGLRQSIIYELHDTPSAGHPGSSKTKRAVRAHYWWHQMDKHIEEYVRTCASCQRNKPLNDKPAGLLHPIEIPRDRWTSVSMDFITQLPTSTGPIPYDAIVVFVDRMTKMVRIAPTTSDVTAEGAAQLLHDHVFRHHGVPEDLITDRASIFTSKMFSELATMLGTKQCLTTAYHPQSDGQTERTNQTLETMLRHYVGSRPHGDWHTCLAAAEFAINNAFTPSIGTTPFRLNYGRDPRVPVSVPKSQVPKAHEWADKMLYGLVDAKRCLKQAQDRQKHYYDQHRRETHYSAGDLVLLSSKNITLRRLGDKTTTPKLMPKWIGPFPITEVIGKGAYRLQLPPHMKAHNVFNVVCLKAYHSDGRYQPPPPVLVDGEEEFTIDYIADHKSVGRTFEYLVRWKGYGVEHNTWEPQKSLLDTEAFERYWQNQGLEPPVHATSRAAVKVRIAKAVYDSQAEKYRAKLAHRC